MCKPRHMEIFYKFDIMYNQVPRIGTQSCFMTFALVQYKHFQMRSQFHPKSLKNIFVFSNRLENPHLCVIHCLLLGRSSCLSFMTTPLSICEISTTSRIYPLTKPDTPGALTVKFRQGDVQAATIGKMDFIRYNFISELKTTSTLAQINLMIKM